MSALLPFAESAVDSAATPAPATAAPAPGAALGMADANVTGVGNANGVPNATGGDVAGTDAKVAADATAGVAKSIAFSDEPSHEGDAALSADAEESLTLAASGPPSSGSFTTS